MPDTAPTPYWQRDGVSIYHGDALAILPALAETVDAVVTDPPYGCGKAEWDDAFPVAWYSAAKRLAPMLVIITGSAGVKDSVALVGDDFVDVVAAWNLNSLTRGPLGFNNWLAAVVACGKPRTGNGVNFFEFAVRGKMPDHPSPKPVEYMLKLVARLTLPGDVLLDPFMGSGTTGVACIQTGRRFIGIELREDYCATSVRRIEKVLAQPRLDLPAPRVKPAPMPTLLEVL